MNRIETKYQVEIAPSLKIMSEKSEELGEAEVIGANTNKVGCVDPRQSKEFSEKEIDKELIFNNIKRVSHEEEAVRSPGGSLGYAMALMGAYKDISAEQAVDLVIAWEKKQGRTFTYHEDEHKNGLGCGHIDLAAQKENEELYGISSDKVIAMRDYARTKAKAVAHVPMLVGEHNEKGVFIVIADYNNPKTVKSTDKTGNEYFRLDKTLHEKNLDSLSLFAQNNGFKVTWEGLKKVSEKQANATLGLLAGKLGKELPIFEVDLRKGKPSTITQKDFVKPIPRA